MVGEASRAAAWLRAAWDVLPEPAAFACRAQIDCHRRYDQDDEADDRVERPAEIEAAPTGTSRPDT